MGLWQTNDVSQVAILKNTSPACRSEWACHTSFVGSDTTSETKSSLHSVKSASWLSQQNVNIARYTCLSAWQCPCKHGTERNTVCSPESVYVRSLMMGKCYTEICAKIILCSVQHIRNLRKHVKISVSTSNFINTSLDSGQQEPTRANHNQ